MPTGPEDSVVDATGHLVGDMSVRVDMKVGICGLGKDQIEMIARKAREICP
ncbi:putative organic hydroperoxide resistance protein [Rosellinia necatrix]|uniref:Putative organic hydroperoxide resistance protein n=1 Tax=Rosellinia necatrix TaxID=77044 RepID=A0A1S8AAS6_ROSNE|nr:putative organic hydroperoxide resistance protein [Rosellinia necatrix]